MKLRVVEPCEEGWDQMEPHRSSAGPEGRHCRRCDKAVVDFTRLTRNEARALLARSKRGQVCGHVMVHRETGRAVFRPDPDARAPRWLGPALVAAIGMGCATDPEAPVVTPVAAVDDPPIGDLMQPVGEEGPPSDGFVTRAVPADEVGCDVEDAGPNDEQRALTRQKHQPPHPPPPGAHTPSTYDIVDGGIGW